MWYLYILECINGALYTGITQNVERRFKEHSSGKGGHYTSYNRPIRILYTEPFQDLLMAERRESQIKRWSKAKKKALFKGDLDSLQKLSISRD